MSTLPPGFLDVLHEYFRGEKLAGSALAVLGAVLLAGAWWVAKTQAGEFGAWMRWGLVVVGGLLLVGGAGLVFKTGPQVADLVARAASDPNGMIADELARMAKVNANWPRLELAWAVIAAAAFVLVLVLRRQWSEALGLVLLLTTTTLMFTDVFGARRAVVYTAALEAQARGG